MIDLFSDTNTDPTPGMRQAMAAAKVGNEVAAEDPTVNALLEKVCYLLGKEAAVFMPSGTMCNGVAFRVLCQRPGDTIILDETAHPLLKSAGLISGLAQAQSLTIKGRRGIFTAEQIKPFLEAPKGYNLSYPRIVSVEQTTNFGGGAIWPLETLQEVCTLAHKHQAYTHMDGARLFNASAETGISLKKYCEMFDSVWIDFCKTLGAPIGAVLAGSQAFIDEAWYYKFQQGGGMHQAGILAAGCLYGLKHHLKKLPEVHALTKKLAKLLETLPFVRLDVEEVETNVIIFSIDHPHLTAFDFEKRLLEKGIRLLALDAKQLRAITHLEFSESALKTVFEAVKDIGALATQ